MKLSYLIILLVMNFFWAAVYSAYKIIGQTLPTGAIVTLRFGLAGLCLLFAWPWLPGPAPRGRDLAWTCLMGLVLFVLGQRLQVYGNHLGRAGDSAVLMAFEPLITSVIAGIVLHEHIGPRRWAGFGLGFAGVALLHGIWRADFRWTGLGASLIFVSSFICEAAYTVMGKKIAARVSVMKMLAISLLVGTGANIFIDGRRTLVAAGALSGQGWWILAALAVLCTAIGYSIWFIVIKECPVNVAALTVFAQSVFGVALASLWLRETLRWEQLFGCLAIVAGLALGLSRQIKGPKPLAQTQTKLRNVNLPIFGLLLLGVYGANGATFVVAQQNKSCSDTGPGDAQRPWKTISQAAQTVAAGDCVLIEDGIYREHIVISTSGTADRPIRFDAAPGAHVVLTGADRLTNWGRSEGKPPIYHVPWPHRFVPWSAHMTHPDDEYHRLIGRCEQVAVDNYLLHQVLNTNSLAPGCFCADVSNQILYVWDSANRDLDKVLVEASTRQEILEVKGAHVYLTGLRFRFAANMAQHGAVVLTGINDTLEDCVLESMNSSGATFAGESQSVRRCVFRDNGQLGFGANGAHHLLFSECLVENNNTKGFDRGWEAGGDKLVLCREAVLERSRFIRNRGNGIWFDIGNEQCTVRGCFISENEDSGIFDEISFGLRACDNVITGNGFASTKGAWGAQAGIVLSSSPDSIIERNLILGNREGFNFREQSRTTARIGSSSEVAVWNHDEIIRSNIIVFNRDAQIWGWFDIPDGRHWPGTLEQKQNKSAVPTVAGPADHQLTLEKLNLHFQGNVYCARPGQGLFEWGVSWRRHESYASLTAFYRGLKIDQDSQSAELSFSDPASGDFRLSRDELQKVRGCYPVDDVPQVRLGIQTKK